MWFAPGLAANYQPRGSLWALARQYFDYGRWKSVVLRAHPSSLRARHLAPPLLVLALLTCAAWGIAGALWAAALPLGYVLTLLLWSAALGLRRRDPAVVLVPLVLAAIHLSWGTGFLISARRKVKKRQNPSQSLPLPPQ